MQIKVSGKQIDIGDALREHVEAGLTDHITKYTDRATDASVSFSRDRHEFRCDCSAHLSTGLTAQASAKATDIYASFERAVERLDKQLRRYKRRLKDHHKARPDPIETMAAAAYVIEAAPEENEPETLQPVIIAEMSTGVPNLSVGEAVMQMEMGGEPVLMFRNEKSGALNVVYRRDDGNIGWIDPDGAMKASA